MYIVIERKNEILDMWYRENFQNQGQGKRATRTSSPSALAQNNTSRLASTSAALSGGCWSLPREFRSSAENMRTAPASLVASLLAGFQQIWHSQLAKLAKEEKQQIQAEIACGPSAEITSILSNYRCHLCVGAQWGTARISFLNSQTATGAVHLRCWRSKPEIGSNMQPSSGPGTGCLALTCAGLAQCHDGQVTRGEHRVPQGKAFL